jgi:hypothetical protein
MKSLMSFRALTVNLHPGSGTSSRSYSKTTTAKAPTPNREAHPFWVASWKTRARLPLPERFA